MNTLTAPPPYATPDLGQAAFLVALGHPLQGVEPVNDRRKRFVFPAAAQEAAERYYQNVPIPARAYFNAVRDLKALIAQH